MLKAYRYRIYPNKEQEIQLAKTFGCCRFVYNQTLAYRKDAYEKEKKSVSKTDCNNYCNRELKKVYEWLKEVDKFALTNAIYNMDSAYQKFFKENAGYPKFKSKHSNRKSYTTNFTSFFSYFLIVFRFSYFFPSDVIHKSFIPKSKPIFPFVFTSGLCSVSTRIDT